MNIGILANEGSWYFRDLDRAARALGHTCVRLDFQRLISRVGVASSIGTAEANQLRIGQAHNDSSDPIFKASEHFDVVIVRTMPPGSLEQVVYRMDILGRIQATGTMVINSPKALECAVDKYLTTARLHAGGLPVPETVICEHEDDAMQAFSELGGDVVVKPLFGSEGRGIVRVSDPDLAHRTFRTLMRLNSVLYLQKFVEHEGFDVRVMVLDGKVLGGMRRRSMGDFRTNVARSAVTERHEVTDLEADLARRAAKISDSHIAGIDLLYDRLGRCYVIEVNAVPGWQAFQRTTGIDVARELLESVENPRKISSQQF